MTSLNKDSNKASKQQISLTQSKNTQEKNQSQQIPVSSNSITNWCSSTKQSYSNWKKQACGWFDRPQIQQLQKQRKEFANQYCHPIGNFYRDLPPAITELKFNYIANYQQKQRLFTVQALTLLTVIVSLRAKKDIGVFNRVLLSARNSLITFSLGGLFIAPEIYNPIIKSDI